MDRIKSRRSQPKSLFCSPRRIRCFFTVDWSVSISWQRGTYLHSTFGASGLSFISARPRCGQGQIRNPENVKIEWWFIIQNQPKSTKYMGWDQPDKTSARCCQDTGPRDLRQLVHSSDHLHDFFILAKIERKPAGRLYIYHALQVPVKSSYLPENIVFYIPEYKNIVFSSKTPCFLTIMFWESNLIIWSKFGDSRWVD